MPKIKKERAIQRDEELKRLNSEKALVKRSMFSSALITYVFALAFFIVSFIFNGRFYEIDKEGRSWEVFEVLIKSFSIIGFFFFMFVSVGNYQELRGYVLSWKQMVFLIVLAILQSSTELYVFLVVLIGITLVITYMYFIQGALNLPPDTKRNYVPFFLLVGVIVILVALLIYLYIIEKI